MKQSCLTFKIKVYFRVVFLNVALFSIKINSIFNQLSPCVCVLHMKTTIKYFVEDRTWVLMNDMYKLLSTLLLNRQKRRFRIFHHKTSWVHILQSGESPSNIFVIEIPEITVQNSDLFLEYIIRQKPNFFNTCFTITHEMRKIVV